LLSGEGRGYKQSMKKIKTVVWATDFKDQATGALGAAAILAGATGAHLIACHVVPEKEKDSASSNAEKELNKALKSIPMARFPMSSVVLAGESADEIIDLCKNSKADVLVFGCRQIDQDPLTLGSLAERLLRFSPVDCLIVRSSGWPRGRFAVMVDMSENSARAVERGAEMAKIGKQKTMDVVLALNPEDVHLQVKDRSDAGRRLEAWLRTLNIKGIKPRSVVVDRGHKGLAKWALVEGIDLIMSGSRGLGKCRTDPLGSFVLKTARVTPSTMWVTK